MEKYKQVLRNAFAQYTAYRLNFFLWRIRVILSILMSYFLWYSVYQAKTSAFGYSQQQMLTYILLITFLNGIILSTQTFRVAQEIQDGSLSNVLMQPVNFFGFNIARDMADKLINTFFSVFELGLLMLLLKPDIVISKVEYIILFFMAVVLATALFFCINMLLSFIGFWSRETWAPRFIFSILVTFLAGTYFPLDILPQPVYFLLRLLPFTYLIYFPLKVYLGQLPTHEIIGGFFIASVWCIMLIFLMNIVWKKGLKLYTAEGI